MSATIEPPKIEWLICSSCGAQNRKHELLFERVDEVHDDEIQETYTDKYQLFRCGGCSSVRFRHMAGSTLSRDPYTGELEWDVRVYPEFDVAARQGVLEPDDLPENVATVYGETVVALRSGTLLLAGAGLRAIVEALCIDQKVKGKNLKKKIDALVTRKLLASPQAELLHHERYLGNDALHEMARPSKQEVEEGLSVLEGLLNTIYVLPRRAEAMKNARAKRKASKTP